MSCAFCRRACEGLFHAACLDICDARRHDNVCITCGVARACVLRCDSCTVDMPYVGYRGGWHGV